MLSGQLHQRLPVTGVLARVGLEHQPLAGVRVVRDELREARPAPVDIGPVSLSISLVDHCATLQAEQGRDDLVLPGRLLGLHVHAALAGRDEPADHLPDLRGVCGQHDAGDEDVALRLRLVDVDPRRHLLHPTLDRSGGIVAHDADMPSSTDP